MKTKSYVAMVAGAVGMAMLLAGVAQAGDGSLMEVTTTIKQSMPGMRAMPPRTLSRTVCTHPGSFDPHTLNRLNSRNQCKIAHFQKQGDTVTFDEVCTAPMAMTMHGTFRTTGGSNFTGSMHASFDAGGGRPMTMDTEYTGKQVGSCNYTPPKTSS